MKVPKNSLYGMFGGFPTISEMYNNKCFCCPADRQGNRCCGEKWCVETWKRYEAIINPEWHHVSLNTLANLDFDMLAEHEILEHFSNTKYDEVLVRNYFKTESEA